MKALRFVKGIKLNDLRFFLNALMVIEFCAIRYFVFWFIPSRNKEN